MQADVPAEGSEPPSAEQARARVEQLRRSLGVPEIVEFVKRARAARR
jgi:hypothetical protein